MKNNKTSLKRKAYGVTMNVLMGVAVTLTCALVLFLIVYILYKGLPNITWELLSTSPSYLSGTIGILPDILNTVYLVLATLVFVLPLGVGAAIYLTEYAKNKRTVAIIEYAAETLSGIPSIIYGLVGMLFFCQFLGFQTSIIAGALTLVFTLGALLFVVSDFIMIYYSFGKKIKPLRAINLLCYYVGQLMIAVCILLA